MNENTLYAEYISGSDKALEKLMEIYGDKLTLYINGYVKNIHDAEELMIDVFAYIVVKRPSIKTSFNNYVYKAARNYALAFLRRKKKVLFPVNEIADFSIEAAFENAAELKERDMSLYSCLDMLSSSQKEVLYLVYIENMSYKETAAVLNKTVKQIDKLLQLGKKKIKPLLEKEGITGAFNS